MLKKKSHIADIYVKTLGIYQAFWLVWKQEMNLIAEILC